MNIIILSIGIMNILDLLLTLQWISINPSMEGNPLMLFLWGINPVAFILFKLSITLLFCIVAFRLKENKLMRLLISIPFIAYLSVIYLQLLVTI